MGKIQVMSRDLANRIAAGEVIERPASVVKELVENSIDAGAKRIFIQIERAGTRLIQVRDDGSGMSEEDAMLSLQPHGTSKLKDISDLDNILTLGFRGEALPSIASVSKFTLRTREKEAAIGTKISYAPDGTVLGEPDGTPVGTTVEVRDLFHNTPARKKFLKSPATEEHHIEEVVLTLALGHPEVGFELRIDNRAAFILASDSSAEVRIRELFGKNFAANMLKIDHRENGLHLTGFIGSPGFTRPSRKEQRIFINSRAVESLAVYRGIRDGFGTLAPDSGRFPPAVLYLDMDPGELDVNVHPAKREVRFRSEFAITRAVAAAVGNALRGMADVTPETENIRSMPLSGKVPVASLLDAAMVHYHAHTDDQPTFENMMPEKQEQTASVPEEDNIIPVFPTEPQIPVEPEEEKEELPSDRLTDRNPEQAPYAPRMNIPETPVFGGDWPETVLGVYDNTYILCSGKEGLMLVDQHAAHERILFEQIVAAAESGNVSAQKLLLPKTLELPRSQVGYLLNHQELFAGLGFDIESAGGNTVLVNSVPADFANCRGAEEIIPDMLAELLERSEIRHGAADLAAAARAACKAAVKAHEAKTLPELEKLLRDLRACRQGTLCPHGRPTMITLSRLEIERRFGRR